MMFQNLLLVIIFGLRFQRLRYSNDPIDIVPAYLEITLFQIFVSVGSPALVILEPTLVLFFIVVICQMNAR